MAMVFIKAKLTKTSTEKFTKNLSPHDKSSNPILKFVGKIKMFRDFTSLLKAIT